MDRPGVGQVPEGSGEHGKMEKTGCKIICGAPTTLAVKGLMMMMMNYVRPVVWFAATAAIASKGAGVFAVMAAWHSQNDDFLITTTPSRPLLQ